MHIHERRENRAKSIITPGDGLGSNFENVYPVRRFTADTASSRSPTSVSNFRATPKFLT